MIVLMIIIMIMIVIVIGERDSMPGGASSRAVRKRCQGTALQNGGAASSLQEAAWPVIDRTLVLLRERFHLREERINLMRRRADETSVLRENRLERFLAEPDATVARQAAK